MVSSEPFKASFLNMKGHPRSPGILGNPPCENKRVKQSNIEEDSKQTEGKQDKGK